MSYHFVFKYIIIGDTGVGKSSLLLQFIQGKFKEKHEITVGVEFGSKNIQINEKNIKLQVWDTAGQEDFKSITRSYYRSSAGGLVVYDISRRDTFEHVIKWIEDAKQNGNPYMTFLLIGNKSDLEESRQVSYDEGKKVAEEYGMKFIETSAKNTSNVEQVFMETANGILQKIEDGTIDPTNASFGVKTGQESGNLKLINTEKKKIENNNSNCGFCNSQQQQQQQ